MIASILAISEGVRRTGMPYVFSMLGAGAMGLVGLRLIGSDEVVFAVHPITNSFDFMLRGDPLSGLFVLVISLLTIFASVYSIGYTREHKHAQQIGVLYPALVLSIYAVVLSANVVTFLISWETMSVVSYFLVTVGRDDVSMRAGLVYAVMTHIGTAFLVAAFLVLGAATGSMEFSAMQGASQVLPQRLRDLVFVFVLIGFGVKAGLVPLHTWLPRAYPVAPSNITALMSGLMSKTGLYGFLRIVMDVLGSGPEWWGLLVVGLGALSALTGILYALTEQDLKRLLAFSSIENMGIIMLGVGASMMFMRQGLVVVSAMALMAALYHMMNHAMFKGLLFMSAGSVVQATGTSDLEKMGGIIKVMPWTGLLFLVGSLSICALPPFNGFMSEWLTFQSLLLGFEAQSVSVKLVAALGCVALAMTGALAAGCFVKAFGIGFLGVSREVDTKQVREADGYMLAGMGGLAVMCLALGIFPTLVGLVLDPVAYALTGEHALRSAGGTLKMSGMSATVAPMYLLAALLAAAAGIWIVKGFLGGRRRIIYEAPWDCGMRALDSRMQYTAIGFTKPARMIFKNIYRPRTELKISYSLRPLFVRSIMHVDTITPFFEKYLYKPVSGFIYRTAERAAGMQSGSLHLYLSYILITLVILLLVV